MMTKIDLHIGLIGPLPPPFGGMANQAKQLYDLLGADHVKVSFVQTNAPYPTKHIVKIRGIRALFRLFPYLSRIWKLTSEVQVIHLMANSGWSWQLYSAPVLWIAWLRKTPVIVNYRGGEAQSYFLKSIAYVRPSINRAAAVIVPSNYLQKIFSDFSISSEIIPNIIDLQRFKPVDKKVDVNFPHLIITRNLEAIYGIETAIKAIKMLVKKVPNIKLSIAGSGDQLPLLQKLVNKLKLERNIIFTGKLNAEEIIKLYHSADIMLNPTTVDNMPNSILEALACGIPVVTTDVGGIPFIVKDEETALFTRVNDPNMMGDQVLRLIRSDQLYDKLRLNGLSEVKRYDWKQIKKLWLELYCRVLK